MGFNDTKFVQLPMGRDGWQGFERSVRFRNTEVIWPRGTDERGKQWIGKNDCSCSGKWQGLLIQKDKNKTVLRFREIRKRGGRKNRILTQRGFLI